ncbi:MAG: protein rep [Planctomycetes bacterium]|nr:protein rep [Planctomycetota bacterium]
MRALEACPERYRKKLRAKLRGMPLCGEFVTQVFVLDGRVDGVARNRCGCRGCSVCDSLHAADVKRDLKQVIDERFEAGARFSMITLTIPHSRSDDLHQLMEWMFKAVHRFQRSVAFKRHVKGWVRGMEIPWNERNGFNPHFHFLVEADLWPMDEIKALWTRSMKTAGGPEVPPHGTHVQELRDRGQGLEEVLGYPFKRQDLTRMPGSETCRLLAETKGRHLAQLCRKWSRRVVELAGDSGQTGRADDAQGRVRLSPNQMVAQVNAGNRQVFDLLVQAAQLLGESWVTGGVASRLAAFLRSAVEAHGWPMPDLPVRPEEGEWSEP